MAFKNYAYFSGSFAVTWLKTTAAGDMATVVDLGTTREGIRLLVEPDVHEITEDRLGSTVVELWFRGIRRMMVRMDSMIWRDFDATNDAPMVNIANQMLSDGAGANYGIVQNEALGGSMVWGQTAPAFNGIRGLLTCTAVTGRLKGTSIPMSYAFPCAVPLDAYELLLELPRPIEVPLHFQILPDLSVTDFTTSGNLKYFTQVLGDGA